MTLENFEYRTNPLFLRHQFAKHADKYGIPMIPKPHFTAEELEGLRLLGFYRVRSDNGQHRNRMVHFFLYDYNFERIWKNPEPDVELLKQYRGVLTPDFSMYTEMPLAMLLYNTFRNRWCGAYLADKGIRVVPTVNWATEESFDFCFAGIEKGSIVAVSTYMFHAHGCHEAQEEIFMKGYRELLRRVEPECIICYSEPFPEMEGNILYVDYDLSSWQHMEDDAIPEIPTKNANNLLTNPAFCDRITKIGYVLKGGGSAYGGKWRPKKKEDENLLGEPNTIKRISISTKKGSYEALVKYDAQGRAIKIRHLTDHSEPKWHTNPHDHIIDWSNEFPNFKERINYWDGNVPEFKSMQKGVDFMEQQEVQYTPEDLQLESLGEFKFRLSCGWCFTFLFHGVEYGVGIHNEGYYIWLCDGGDDLAENLTLEEVLDFPLDGVKLRNLILDAEITEWYF